MATDPTKDKSQQAIADAEAEAAAKKAARDAANAEEAAALQALQAKELEGLQQHNAAQYSNLGQIVGDIQSKIDVAKAKDETAQKRENAYRYISGLGDTLSSLANLVGVANKASNQQQTYNSHAVVQKAEEARKARKIEMDDLSKRADEMQARLRDMKAAGSLSEAQMGVQHQKEQMALKAQQEARELAAAKTAYEQQKDAQDYALKAAELNLKAGTAAAEAQYKSGMLGVRRQEANIKQQKASEQAKKQKEYTRKAVFGNMVSFAGEDGEPFSIGEKTLRRNTEFALPTMKEDIAQQAGFSSFAEYEQFRGLSDRKKKKFLEERRIEPNDTLLDALNELGRARPEDVEDIVKKHGRLSPAFMKQLRTAAQKDEDEFSSVWGEEEEEEDDTRSLKNTPDDQLTDEEFEKKYGYN